MDCFSWSLPAGKAHSCPMENLSPNSICNSCYAQQNRYRFPSVRNAQLARFSLLKDFPNRCASLLLSFFSSNTPRYFRVHDSGDFHSIDSIRMWTDIIRASSSTTFWIPTRAWTFPRWMPALTVLSRLPNAIVRPSALHFNDPPPLHTGLAAGSTSSTSSIPSVYDCPKSINHTSCEAEGCRVCWTPHVPVNYLPHGRLLPNRPTPLTPLTHKGIALV